MFINHEYIEKILEDAKGAKREDIRNVLNKAKKEKFYLMRILQYFFK